MRRLLFFSIFLSLLIHSTTAAVDSGKQAVLVLNSYHHGYKWTDEIIGGIEEILRGDPAIQIHFDYMDTKRNYSPEYLRILYEYLRSKIGLSDYDLVIAADDNAFEFVKKYHDTIFKDVPVVVCGVNFMDVSEISAHRNFTGISEGIGIERNFELILNIHPDTGTIYVINDKTPTGRGADKMLQAAISKYKDRVDFVVLDDLTFEELIKRVGEIRGDSIIFYMIFLRDRAGRSIDYDESIYSISAVSQVPVYGTWNFSLGLGITGGFLASGRNQGRVAAEMAKLILSGIRPSDIPPVLTVENTYYFDYVYLKKYSIPRSRLPEGSVIINAPEPLPDNVMRSIAIMSIALTGLIAVIIFMKASDRRRRLAEKDSIYMSRFMRLLIDSMPISLFILDDTGIITDVNEHALDFFSLTKEGSTGREFFDVMPYCRGMGKNIAHCIHSGKTSRFKKISASVSGKTLVLEISCFPMLGNHKNNIVVLIDDLTEIEQKETQLRQSQKMEMIGTLAGGLAHDFNNVLSGITGSVSLLKLYLKDSGEKIIALINIIEQSGERAREMIKRLLTLAQKQETRMNPMSLARAIQNVINVCKNSFDKSVTIRLNVRSDDNAMILGDSSQIEQMFLNLIVNAYHAMTLMEHRDAPNGGTIEVDISTISADSYFCLTHPEAVEDAEYRRASVTDAGVGIEKKMLAKIFDPFFTTKKEGHGTGLGLAMVYTMVKQHNGFIDVYSEPGKGSTFIIYLPVTDQKETTGGTPVEKGLKKYSGTLLLVDDEEVVREVAGRMLSDLGFEVIKAVNGKEGVQKLKENAEKVSIVILDMSMPVMSGREAYKAMRKISPGVKIILASGYAQDKRVREILSMGADGFLQKPYTFTELMTSLENTNRL